MEIQERRGKEEEGATTCSFLSPSRVQFSTALWRPALSPRCVAKPSYGAHPSRTRVVTVGMLDPCSVMFGPPARRLEGQRWNLLKVSPLIHLRLWADMAWMKACGHFPNSTLSMVLPVVSLYHNDLKMVGLLVPCSSEQWRRLLWPVSFLLFYWQPSYQLTEVQGKETLGLLFSGRCLWAMLTMKTTTEVIREAGGWRVWG